MQIILLSGGSGTRLWPLSNDARSKQFLKYLPGAGEERISMLQRVATQLKEAGIAQNLTVATASGQKDSVRAHLGDEARIVVEPARHGTFPAICLACEFLSFVEGCPDEEVVVAMPCDPYTGPEYFQTVRKMGAAVEAGEAPLILMGVRPNYPSAKYGYILPAADAAPGSDVIPVKGFVEKPSAAEAENLIEKGAYWNGGVFAFRLGYVRKLASQFVDAGSYDDALARFDDYPKISFDLEVAEKCGSMAMVAYNEEWKDLGTWNTLTDELDANEFGNVITDGTGSNTHIFNELGLPLLCLGTKDLVIAASPDGILVSEKKKSENIKHYAQRLKNRPMYEERAWGTYVVVDNAEYPDGYRSLTKRLTLNPGRSISYQKHSHRDEIWTFVDGEGTIVIDDVRKPVRRGDTVVIKKGSMHTLKATTPLTFIEVQTGYKLVEEDIERFPFDWEKP